MPKLSIIIPTYNSVRTLKQCLESVLKQSFSDFEVFIIDGLSEDATLGIAKKFNDNRVKIFSEKDEGIYDAMNKGIKLAQGEWLYFLGSDDTLYDNEVLKKIFGEIQNADYDFVHGNVWFLKDNTIHCGEVNRKRLMTEANICHQAIFYKKTLFERLGKYNLNFEIWADWDFNIRCFSYPETKIKYIDLIIANFNNCNGLSARVVDSVFEKILPLDYKNERLIEEFKADSKEFQLGNKLYRQQRRIKKIIKFICFH